MGADQSTPESNTPTPTGTQTGTQTPTQTSTQTPTASITPNISDASSPSASGSYSASASVSSSASVSYSPHSSLSSIRSSSVTATSTAAGPVICGSLSSSAGIWKTHGTAGQSAYLNNINCQSTFIAPNSMLIQYTAISQQLEECCDFIRLYDGPSISSRLIVTIAGSSIQLPGSWISTGNTMTIQFTTDVSVVFLGGVANVNFLNIPTFSASALKTITPSPAFTRLASSSSIHSRKESSSALESASVSVSKSAHTSNKAIASSSASPLESASVSTSGSAEYSQSASASVSTTSSTQHSNTPSASSSATTSESRSPNESNSPFQTMSLKESNSPTGSIHPSYTSSASAVYSHSATISLSPSYSFTQSTSWSTRGTSTLSLSASVSSSALPTSRPRGPPPPLPDNLGNLSLSELSGLFNELAYYDPSKLQNALNALGFAAMQKSGGEFAVSTDTFSLKMKALDASAPAALQIGSTNLSLPPLSTLGSGLAASMIQWTVNPYESQSSAKTDTLPLSLNILDSYGKQMSVNNLTNPITFSWNLNTSDSKFHTPPFYMARCDKDDIYIKNGYTFDVATSAIRTGHATWNVPCLLDSWAPVNCTDYNKNSFETYECPSPIFTPNCLYWHTQLNRWSSDGCTPTFLNTSIACSCTHLTDFTSRIDAVAKGNAELFANAANVYSLSGLIKFAQWFGIFGGIATATILLGLLAMRIDLLTTRKYVSALCNDEVVNAIFNTAPNSAIYIFDKNSNKKCVKPNTKPNVIVKKDPTLVQRICQQHSRVQFLFRYDPRLSRIFRLLALFAIQYHSLFVTALFYGFTYGGAGKASMAISEIVLLSIITSALNVPVISLIMSSLNKIGLSEFKHKFPILYEEYDRRSRFEKYALQYLGNHSKTDIVSMDHGMNTKGAIDMDEDSFVDLILMYLCCKNTEDDEEENIVKLPQRDLLVKMIKVIKAKYPGAVVYDKFWSYMPCHTPQGWAFLILCGGWLAWCLNYLLLFAASHEKSVGEDILVSYATSELTTVFISQPITIMITYGIFKLTHTYKDYLPKCLHRFAIFSSKNNIPAHYFFGNPLGVAESAFTSKFAYSLFIRCPSIASNTNELAYAPTKAAVHDIEGDIAPCEVEKLYNQIMKIKGELQLREAM